MNAVMTSTSAETVHAKAPHHDNDHASPGIMKYLWTYDHKMIGLQYLWTAFFFLAIGGALALAVRFQLGFPNHPIPLIGYHFTRRTPAR